MACKRRTRKSRSCQ